MSRLSPVQRTNLTILIAALGYFVDVFDLQLFSMLRVGSLQSLNLTPAEITTVGAQLLNWQMAGMLLGGILWGVLGDKRGRVYVLFGTILLYSIGNIANAFVTTIPAYAAARFFTGLGLAGEIGAGITLATELLPKETRSYGATIVVSCGVMAPILASYMADALDWRFAYLGGGVLGLLLLALRMSVSESGLFTALGKQENIARGHFLMLFKKRRRLLRYLGCIALGVPIWFVLGVIVIFSPEIGKALGIATTIKAPTSIVSYSIGLTLGSIVSGLLSQVFRKRRKVIAIFMGGMALTTFVILFVHGITAPQFYGLILLDGFFIGYWTLFMTVTAELFGTNLRATAATSVPNFVRASIIFDTFLIGLLRPELGFMTAVKITAALCFALGAFVVWRLPETFNKDLDFMER